MIEFMTDISVVFYDVMEEFVQMLEICFPFIIVVVMLYALASILYYFAYNK